MLNVLIGAHLLALLQIVSYVYAICISHNYTYLMYCFCQIYNGWSYPTTLWRPWQISKKFIRQGIW